MLEARDVSVTRAGRSLIDGVCATFRPGRLTAVIGPNGAGKSTLVKAISGYWPLDAGRVTLDGRAIARMRPNELAARRVVVPQSAALSFPFTVLGVVMLGRTVPSFGDADDPDLALDCLDEVGLAGFEQRFYTELSGGERQRVHIARALCQLRASPARTGYGCLFILDEPTSSLDPGHQALVLSVLRAQADAGTIVIAVLHDLNLAAAWADDILLLVGGRVATFGSPRDVITTAILTAAYGCPMIVDAPPGDGTAFVLPHHARPLPGGTRAAGDQRPLTLPRPVG